MATTSDVRPPIGQSIGEAPVSRTMKPIKWWAAIGACFIAFAAYLMIRWIASGPEANTFGRDEVPTFMTVAARIWEIGGVTAYVALIWWFLVRPWRRTGRPSLDGLLVASAATLFWQDMFVNYSQWWVTYNTTLINFGSWYGHIPGWIAPNADRYAEGALFGPPFYVYMVFPGLVVGTWVMRWSKRRWPTIGKAGQIGVCFAALVAIDIILEPMFMRIGLWSYPGAIRELCLFPGTYYQYPIYEGVIWGATWTAMACLRSFRNDRGETLAERGVSEIRGGGGRQTLLRFLAIAGVLNVMYLGICNIPYQFIGMNADPWPEDVTSRPYLTNGLCGPGTDYACPGHETPINRPGSLHVTPSGELSGR